jgi:AcrR family transcriptional regulator
MGRPKEHGEARRQELLRRAGQILQSEGIGALSLRRLSADAQTTTRAIYSLFGSKDGLLSAMYSEMGETMTRLHLAVPHRDDLEQELLELCQAYRTGALEYPSLYPILFGGVPGFAPTPADVSQARRGFLRVVATFERASARNLFEGRDPEALGLELWALVHGLATLELRGVLGGARRSKTLWNDACSAMISGLRAASAREP